MNEWEIKMRIEGTKNWQTEDLEFNVNKKRQRLLWYEMNKKILRLWINAVICKSNYFYFHKHQ